VGFEDASRADPAFLVQAAQRAQRHGAMRVRYADTLGLLDPFATHARIAALRARSTSASRCTPTTTSAWPPPTRWPRVRAGATHASTTVNGLGERAGNAALEEVVMAARHLHGWTAASTPPRCRPSRNWWRGFGPAGGRGQEHRRRGRVHARVGHPRRRPAEGPRQLRSLPARGAGPQHRLVLGKHSGSHGVQHACARLGLVLDEPMVQSLLERIRAHVSATKRAPRRRRPAALLPRNASRGANAPACRLIPHPWRAPMPSLTERLKALSSAEDFFTFFGLPFDEQVVQVNRLHILKRFYQYLHKADPARARRRSGAVPPLPRLLARPTRTSWRRRRQREKVFKVFQRPTAPSMCSWPRCATACPSPGHGHGTRRSCQPHRVHHPPLTGRLARQQPQVGAVLANVTLAEQCRKRVCAKYSAFLYRHGALFWAPVSPPAVQEVPHADADHG
jgi:hypothetical protein